MLAKGARWRRALSLLEAMRGRGAEADAMHYNSAITALGRAGCTRRALVLFQVR